MEPEIHPSLLEETRDAARAELPVKLAADSALAAGPEEYRGLRWIFIGPRGLRAGWSVAIFIALFFLFSAAVGTLLVKTHLFDPKAHFTAFAAFFGELIPFLGMVGAAALVALIERRRSLLDFNLTGPRRPLHFISGLVAAGSILGRSRSPVRKSSSSPGCGRRLFCWWALSRRASSAAICSSP
jgi:hypothetical protein